MNLNGNKKGIDWTQKQFCNVKSIDSNPGLVATAHYLIEKAFGDGS